MTKTNPNSKKDLMKEIEKLRKENENLKKEIETVKKEKNKVEEDFKEYKSRHPETVGVKNEKPYAILKNHVAAHRKKSGAKIGHTGHYRRLPPKIDENHYVPIDMCPHCGSKDLSSIQETRARVIEDISAATKILRYRTPRRYCRNCKKIVETPIQNALPHSRFSLRVMRMITFMKTRLRIPIELIAKLLDAIFGLKISKGAVSNVLVQMAKYYGPVYERIKSDIREAPARNMDETTWREDGQGGYYVWAFVTKKSALYKIANTRSHSVPERILGRHKGVDIHDRYSGYKFLEKTNRQQDCWAHIINDAEELVEFYGDEGKYILSILKEVYKRAIAFDHKGTEEDVAMLYEALATNLSRVYQSIRCAKYAKNLLAEGEDKLFEFVRNPDVDSTNNRAERAVRPVVVIRKVSGGTRSEQGSRTLETLLSVTQTCNLRGLNFLTTEPEAIIV